MEQPNRKIKQSLPALCRLLKIPVDQLHLLFVDGAIGTCEGYEQKGSVASMFAALRYVVPGIGGEHITVDLLKEIHRTCTAHDNEVSQGQFRKSYAYFGCDKKLTSVKAIAKFLKRMAAKHDVKTPHYGLKLVYGDISGIMEQYDYDFPANKIPYVNLLDSAGEPVSGTFQLCYDSLNNKKFIAWLKKTYKMNSYEYLAQFIFNNLENEEKDTNLPTVFFVTAFSECLEEESQGILDDYYADLTKCKTPKKKLFVIVETTLRLDLLHAFGDGNGRVFTNITLNRMLLENGFLPAVFFDPNIFGSLHPVEDLVQVVIEGMNNTRKLMSGVINLFDAHEKIVDWDLESQLRQPACEFMRFVETELIDRLKIIYPAYAKLVDHYVENQGEIYDVVLRHLPEELVKFLNVVCPANIIENDEVEKEGGKRNRTVDENTPFENRAHALESGSKKQKPQDEIKLHTSAMLRK